MLYGKYPEPPPKKRARTTATATATDAPPVPRCHPFDKHQRAPTPEEHKALREMEQNTDAWTLERKKRQGASGTSCAVGLGPATPLDYWRVKTGRIERDDTDKGLWIMDRGHELEPVAAQWYEVLMERRLETVGIVVHPDVPWIHASPDRLIRGCPEGIVEIKCPVFCLPPTDRPIKDNYMCQVQQQMACTGAEWCDLAFFYRDDLAADGKPPVTKGMRIWRIWRDRRYWAQVLGVLDRFADCLMEDREPTTDIIPLSPRLPRPRTELVLDWDFTEFDV